VVLAPVPSDAKKRQKKNKVIKLTPATNRGYYLIMIIKCIVIPESKKNTITALSKQSYQVTLKAKPEHNQANALLISALSEYFSLPKSSFRFIAGFHTRTKRIEIIESNNTTD
jgi:uncharacterized protein YggU (UPF0235/DUF167 family)